MASLYGKRVKDTFKSLLKLNDNDIISANEKQITDGLGGSTSVFIDTYGNLRANKYKVTGAGSGSFLKGDGSLDTNAYLTTAMAASTYLTISAAAATYLPITTAAATYLTIVNAASTYLPIGADTDDIPEGATNKYFTNARAIASTLTGFTPIIGTVTSADSIKSAIEKIYASLGGGGGGGGDFVPYVGADDNVDLGEFGMLAGFLQFDTTPTGTPTDQGTEYWDADEETLALVMNGTTGHSMQDLFFNVKNQTGFTITKGTNVGFAGTVGASGRLLIQEFTSDGSMPAEYYMGVTNEDIMDGANGKVLAFGKIRHIDTSAWPDGTLLYCSDVAGHFTDIKPTSPNLTILVAAVVHSSATVGVIQVRPSYAQKIADASDVRIADLADEDILQWNETNLSFENINIFTALGATDVGKALLSIPPAGLTIPPTTKPRGIRINVDNTVSALEVGDQGYIPYYDSTDFYINSPIFVDSYGKVIVGGETGFYDFTVIGEAKADNFYVNTFAKIIAETADDSLSFSTYDGTDWIQNLRLYNNGGIKQSAVTNALIGADNTGLLRAGTKADLETILGAPATSGSLTANYVPVATDVDSIIDSMIYQDGSNGIVINGTSAAYKLQVNGTFGADELNIFGTGKVTANLVSGYITHQVLNGATYNNVLRLHKNQDIQQFKILDGIVYADGSGYLAEATSGQIIAGLGFTPYNSTNPDGFIATGTFFATSPLSWDTGTNTISMTQASDLNNGWLSASDWTMFNNKANALSLTSGYVPYASGISTLSNSIIYYNGTNIGINTTSPAGIIHAKASTSFGAIIIDSTGVTGGGAIQYRQNSTIIGMTGVDGAIQGNSSTDLGILSDVAGGSIKLYTNGSPTVKAMLTSDGMFLVGYSTPYDTSKLQVNGNVWSSGNVTASSFIKSGGLSYQYLMADGSVSTISGLIAGLTSGYMPYATSSVSLANTGLYYDGSHFAFGTTSPFTGVGGTALSFNSSTASGGSGGLIFGLDGYAQSYLFFSASDNGLLFDTASGTNLKWVIGGTPRLTILSTGAATFSSSITATSIVKSGGTSSQYLMADGSVSTGILTGTLTSGYVPKATGTNTLGNSLIYDNGTGIGINTTSPSSRALYILHNTAGTYAQTIQQNNATGLGLQIYANLSAWGADPFTISSNSGNIASISSVGAATFSSSVTAASFNGYLQTSGTGQDGRISYNGAYGLLMQGKTAAIADSAIFTPDGSVVWENTTGTINSRFYGGLTVNSLKIATTVSTGSALLINGVADFYNSTNTLLRVYHDGTRAIIESYTGGAYGNISINPSGGMALFGTTNTDVGGSVSGARIITGGNSNGAAMFAINGTSLAHYESPISVDRRNVAGDGNMISFWREGQFKAGIGVSSAYITFNTGNNTAQTEQVRIGGDSLMVGGTSNLYRLTVTPYASVNFGIGVTSFTGTNNAVFMNAVNGGAYTSIPMLINASILGFSTGYTEAGRIDGSQNWFIGGTGVTGGGKLQVTGDINISGQFKINGSAIGGGVPTSRTITINGVTQDLSADRSWTVSGGGGIGGSGTANRIAMFSSTYNITNSSLWEDSSTVISSKVINISTGSGNALSFNGNIVAIDYGSNTSIYFGDGYQSVTLGYGLISKLKTNSQGVWMSLPTSSSGLSSGQLWNDSGTVKIV